MRAAVLVVLVAFSPGCFGDAAILDSEEPDLEDALAVLSNGSALNGEALNGRYLNGRYLNGVYLNGRYLNGRYLNGASLGGRFLDGVSLVGSELRGDLDGTELAGTDFIGVELEGVLDDGSGVPLRIDDARVLPTATNDIWAYSVSILDGPNWVPACGTSASGVPYEAIAVAGLWDYRQNAQTGGGDHMPVPDAITLACRAIGAIAKCVEIGYRPWATHQICQQCMSGSCRGEMVCTEESLQPFHQACTRMVRADFCGDGTPHTTDGTLIEFRDQLSLQTAQISQVEATWDVDGATLIGQVVRSPEDITCAPPGSESLLTQAVPAEMMPH